MQFFASLLAFVLLSSSLLNVSAQQPPSSPANIASTPTTSSCPEGVSIRSSKGLKESVLSAEERQYSAARRAQVLPGAWRQYKTNVLHYAATQNVTIPSYVSRILATAGPTLGIAVSGGGYRAALFGAGTLNALDARNASAVQAGVGGLLQSASYLTGLSGGSWLVTSLYQANFPTLQSLIFGLDSSTTPDAFGGWLTQFGLLTPTAVNTTNIAFLESLVEEVSGKFAAGFPVTITDIWARMLSRHFVNGTTAATFFNATTHGAGETFSGAVNTPTFSAHAQPFPIIVTNTISPHGNISTLLDEEVVPLTNPIYEINPFETGSFDPCLASFVETRLFGSQGTTCVTGFDQASYISGISSNLWTVFNSTPGALEASIVGPLIDLVAATFPNQDVRLDSAIIPNPFKGIMPGTFLDSNESFIALGDGGFDGEVVPIQPLLVKPRNVDVIIAIDANSNTPDNFANGTSLIATQDRAALFPKSYSFPPVPTSAASFVSQGLTKRPTFFGCNTFTDAPLVIYLANGGAPLGQVAVTNTSTFQDTFTPSQIQAMLDQTFDIATQGIPIGLSKDPEWPVCLACAVVDRARARTGEARTGACASCLSRYCSS